MARTVLHAAPIALLLLGGPAIAADDEQPYRSQKELGAAHQIRGQVDWESFAQAVARYPREDGGHQTIAMGNYLAWSLVNVFPQGATVESLSLAAFEEPCSLEEGFGGRKRVHCRIRAELHVRANGRMYRYRFVEPGREIGAHFRTDQRAYAPTRRSEVRALVDEAVRHFQREMQSDGLIEY